MIQTTDIADAELMEDEESADWFDGTNQLDESGVVKVSVPDANAHAWTEIYLEGFGWVPVDFTPPSGDVDESAEYSSILQLFAGLFSVQQEADTGENPDMQQGGMTAVGTALQQNSFVLMPLGVMVLILLAALLCWCLLIRIRPRMKRMQAYRNGCYDEVLSYDYRRLVTALKKHCRDAQIPSLPGEVLGLAVATSPERKSGQEFRQESADVQEAVRLLEKGLYGKTQLQKEEADRVIGFIAGCIRNL